MYGQGLQSQISSENFAILMVANVDINGVFAIVYTLDTMKN